MDKTKKENNDVEVKRAAVVGLSAMMRQSVVHILLKHGVDRKRIICCDVPGNLNGQLVRCENNRVILFRLTGLEKDISYNTIELKGRFPLDARIAIMNTVRPSLNYRLRCLGFDAVINPGDDVWEVIQKVLASKFGSTGKNF